MNWTPSTYMLILFQLVFQLQSKPIVSSTYLRPSSEGDRMRAEIS